MYGFDVERMRYEDFSLITKEELSQTIKSAYGIYK